MKQFVDFITWLQTKLNALQAGFKVSSERALDSDFFENEVVASQLAGSVYDESANIPYQIDITTSDIDNAMGVFTTLAKNENNKSFVSIINEGTEDDPDFKNYTVIPYFQTPVVMDKDLEIGSNHYSRIVVFVNLVILFQVSNVSEITIDSESIGFLEGTFGYTAELVSNRVSGQELNVSKKKASSTSLSFRIINKDTAFTRKLFNIAIGVLPGNTSFSVKLKLTNGQEANLNMVVGTSTLSFARQQLASYNVGLFLYDSRGDNNASS